MRLRLMFALLGLLPVIAQAGAWTQPQGKGIAITNLTYYSTSNYYDSAGQKQSQPTFTKYEFQPYLEYGLTDAITLGGSAYLDAVKQSGESNQGLADPQFFIRGQIYRDDRQVVSLEPLLKLPSSFAHSVSPQGGSKSTDYEFSLRYGRNQPLITTRDYMDFRLGYRARTQGLSDQIMLDAATGIKLDDTWEITPAIRATLATSPKDAASYSENGDLDYSLLKAELGALYHVSQGRALQATLFDHIAGVQTGGGVGASVGFMQAF